MQRDPRSIPLAARFYEPAGYSADESVGWLMKRALMSIAQAADRRLEPKGITTRSGRASSCCSVAGLDSGRAGRETQSDPGAMTRLLDRLEPRFCRRQRCTDDRRVVRVELTQGELRHRSAGGCCPRC